MRYLAGSSSIGEALGVLLRCAGGGVAFGNWQHSVAAGIAFTAFLFTLQERTAR